jgi:hypothetical protein
MMQLTEKQLSEIEECGRCQFTIEQTAEIIEVDVAELKKEMKNNDSAAYKKRHRGRLQAEFEVRKSIIDLAVRSSSQAQELFLKLRNELNVHEA